MKKLEFVDKASKIHNNKYDYLKADYVNNHTKICIICPEHGEFWQTPRGHLSGSGCPKCAKVNKPSNDEFIKLASLTHLNKYNYIRTNYINAHKKIEIICPTHGSFFMKPTNHIDNKQGCPKCGILSRVSKISLTSEEFIKKATEVHSDKYDYSEIAYVNSHTKVKIKCFKHGVFYQTPNNHLAGKDCLKCRYENSGLLQRKTNAQFITQANKVHNNFYNYTKTNYITSNKKVCIMCPIHGEFWQSPNSHLNGKGCSICGHSSKLEKEVKDFLELNNISYNHQKTFKWLKNKANMYLDFYLPEYNIAIECQGKQHFKPVDFSGRGLSWAEKEFVNNIYNDRKKYDLCKINGITILYIFNKKYTHDFYKDKIKIYNTQILKKILI